MYGPLQIRIGSYGVPILPERTVTQPDGAVLQHAERVLRLMDLHDQFEGIVFCDYLEDDLICKPAPASYHRVGFVLPPSLS